MQSELNPILPDYPYTRKFEQQDARKVYYATWGPRLVAQLIDFALIAIPFNLLGNFLWLGGGKQVGDSTDQVQQGFGIPREVHNLLWLLLFIAFCYFTSLRWGTTPGKLWLNIHPQNADGSEIGNLKLLLRCALTCYIMLSLNLIGLDLILSLNFNLLSGFNLAWLPGILLGLGTLLAWFDSQKQCLHDEILRTVVVTTDPLKF